MNTTAAKTLTTSIKITAAIEKEMLRMVIEEGYGLRGKSRWITEATQGFLQMPNYPELVDIADVGVEQGRIISFRLQDSLMYEIENAIIEIRKQYPAIEGVKSKIFRASIVQRLLNRAAFQNLQSLEIVVTQ